MPKQLSQKTEIQLKDQDLRDIIATEVTETTEGFKFRKQKEKANTRGILFEDAGLNSFAFSALISL